MPSAQASLLRNAIAAALPALQNFSEEHASTGAGNWTRKQELGHLIDSASNNHLRFVNAALNGSYKGPSYQQAASVNLHDYAGLPWTKLVDFWSAYNELLAHLVEQIPDHAMAYLCRVGTDDPVTLGFLIEDYVTHMQHHLNHITENE